MPTRSLLARFAALMLLLLLAIACQREATAPRPPARAGSGHPLGLVEVTFSGIGTPQMRATAAVPALSLPSTPAGPRFALNRPASGGGIGDGSILLRHLTTGSFTVGEPGAGGYRYLWATFQVRNAQRDSTPYDTERQNLTFFAASTSGTLLESAITSMARFDGSAADPALATRILPTGSVYEQDGLLVPKQPDVLQVITESEAAAIAAPTGVNVLPYGFVVRKAADGGRTLPASPTLGQFDGVVTFAFKVPLQATPAADPFTISALFLALDDSEIRLTQSIEEQTPAGEAAFLARAQAIGATVKSVLPGWGSYRGNPNDTRTVCTVRTAGPSSSPTAYLIQRVAANVQIADAFSGWPLWASGGVARELGIAAVDGSGTKLPDVPVHVSYGRASVITPWGTGGVRMLPRLDRASDGVTAAACEFTHTHSMRASGFGPLAPGDHHVLALKSDGTVVGWGVNDIGQSTPPPGLTGVVQIAGGSFHSIALKSDGTVVGWGSYFNGETTPPPGLVKVVQIAAGASHSQALKSDGTVVGWGLNTAGQRTPPPGLTKVVQIAAGSEHTLALRSDGTVVGWGNDTDGQATPPPGLAKVVQIAAGGSHSLALTSGGTVVAWGRNTDGLTAVPVALTRVVQIAAGSSHALALRSDSTVVGWGNDDFGQVSPPLGLKNVVQIAAGRHYSLALRSDGTVVFWGMGYDGMASVPADLIAAVP